MAHLYASFADASLAEKAAGALLDYGIRQEDLSLVAHDDYGRTRQTYGADTAGAGYSAAGAVAGYQAAALGGTTLAGGTTVVPSGVGVYDNPGRTDLDPMDADDSTVSAHGDMNPLDQGGPDSAANNSDLSAKHGLSTTTPEDAGEGAVKGTGIGLGVGILASLAALAVPGFGLVLGGGALAAAIGATALTAGAGAIAGGVTGYLKEQGVPGEAAERYHGTVQGGGAVLSLNLPSGDVDQATAQQVLSKYGAADVNTY